MKTITFYSYKGGVGRSLTLANIATRLAEFGKKVCLIDFDLEAPGLHHKFQNELTQPISKGLVDYIHSYAKEGILPETIGDYSIRLRLYNNENIHLIPAGNIDDGEYWKRLSSIDWYNLVYENPNSISFFLDLKQKIKKELQPDFLLIDSRTGISEMSGITISLLADEVIVVSANNKENLMGSRRIIDFLVNIEKSILGKVPKVSYVLSRIPYSDEPNEKGKEQMLIERIKNELPITIHENFFVLHSDRDLELNEEMRIGYDIDGIAIPRNKSIQITKEYLALFEHITDDVLTDEEKTKFNNIKKSERYYREALSEFSDKRIELLLEATKLNPHNIKAQLFLARTYLNFKKNDAGLAIYDNILLKFPNQSSDVYDSIGLNYVKYMKLDKAKEVFNKMYDLFPDERYLAFFGLGFISDYSNDYENSVKYYTMALNENTDTPSIVYNNRANAYRHLGNYECASDDIFKALSIDPEKAIAYLTLAEIYAAQEKISEFYLNLEIALSKKKKDVAEAIPEEKIYAKFLNEERFIKLLEKYDIPIPSYD